MTAKNCGHTTQQTEVRVTPNAFPTKTHWRVARECRFKSQSGRSRDSFADQLHRGFSGAWTRLGAYSLPRSWRRRIRRLGPSRSRGTYLRILGERLPLLSHDYRRSNRSSKSQRSCLASTIKTPSTSKPLALY